MNDVFASIGLCAAGAAMGFINNLAGAGGVLALIAFDVIAGLPPGTANASARPAALAIAGSGAIGFATRGQRIPPRAFRYAAATIPGALLGTLLAIHLPTWVYDLALFTVVSVLAVQLLRKPRTADVAPSTGTGSMLLWFGLVGLHMGFLQIGVGLLSILALSHVHSRDLVHVNVAKMALIAVSATTSVATFAVADAIAWGPALWLALGAGLGSFAASRWSVRRGHHVIRYVVLGVCALMMVRTAVRALTGA